MKINKQTWAVAGCIGTIIGFGLTVVVYMIFTDVFKEDIFVGLRAHGLALICGSFAGAFAYHKVTFGGNKW